MSSRHAVSALNRFGLGGKPGELQALDDPRGWLDAQARGGASAQESAFNGLPTSRDYLQRELAYTRERVAQKKKSSVPATDAAAPSSSDDAPKRTGKVARAGAVDDQKTGFRKTFEQDWLAEIDARYRVATTTDAGFVERLVHFWSNHFAISVDKRAASLYAAPMEREAIRPHVNGRFTDLLLAAETHPGMLRYLDNAQSVGEGSKFATRGARTRGKSNDADVPQRKRGLNENLAREILELHTLGVDGGYQQADVTEFARAITGWGTPLARDFRAEDSLESSFVFRANAHEPGARTVLGKRYADGGVDQGRAVLADLAKHPATAKHLSLKLARHFVSDTPPPALVEQMAATFMRTDGDLSSVYRSMIESEHAWSADARKFKMPADFVISALRAGGIGADMQTKRVVALLQQLGQAPFMPRSPAGYADTAADWTGPDALWKRVQVAQALAQRVPQQNVDPVRVARDALGDTLDADTAIAIKRAESTRDGLALLFASPAFQWRT